MGGHWYKARSGPLPPPRLPKFSQKETATKRIMSDQRAPKNDLIQKYDMRCFSGKKLYHFLFGVRQIRPLKRHV